ERFAQPRCKRRMNIEACTESAGRIAGLQLEDARGSGLGRIEPPELRLRCRQQNVRTAPIRICLEHLARRFRRRLIVAALKMAEGNRVPGGAAHRIERAQTESALAPFDAALRITAEDHHDTAKHAGESA